MKKKTISIMSAILGLALIVCFAIGFAACGGEDKTIEAPTDFTIDPETRAYSFLSNDENAAYYYVRGYKVINGEEEGTYTVSSGRINGGVGQKSGTLDMTEFGWGEYNVNLITSAAAGTDYVEPDPVTIRLQCGVNGTLETSEFSAIYSGDTVDLVIDWWNLADWYDEQLFPVVEFNFYTSYDESTGDLSGKVKTYSVNTWELLSTLKRRPATPDYIWGQDTQALFKALTSSTGYAFDCYEFTASDLGGAGTYYITAQAKSTVDYINDSLVSSVVTVTLTTDEATSTFTQASSSAWQNPAQQDFPYSNTDDQTSRGDKVNTAASQSQTTTNRLAA